MSFAISVESPKLWIVPLIQPAAYLHDAMTDGAILPLPQKHQADHNHSCYGHRDHQQANQCTAAEAEVLSQRTVGFLTGRVGVKESGNYTGKIVRDTRQHFPPL